MVAKTLAQNGARVVINDINEENVMRVAEDIKTRAEKHWALLRTSHKDNRSK